MNRLTVEVMRCEGTDDLPLPAYQTEEAAGLDLVAAVPQTVILRPCEIKLIPTGIRLAIPSGFEGQVRPRSGLALKYGIGLLNSPGTIDSDYRGEVGIIMFNFGPQPFEIERGDRIAQLVIARVEKVVLRTVEALDESRRSSGGFGSTGK